MKKRSLGIGQLRRPHRRIAALCLIPAALCANQSAPEHFPNADVEMVQSAPELPISSADVEAQPVDSATLENGPNSMVQPLILPMDTPIMVFLNDQLASNAIRAGDRFTVTVLKDVTVEDAIVIPAGAQGEGRVLFANDKGAFGRSGLLDIRVETIFVGDQEIPVRGRFRQEGKNNNTAAVATWFAVGIFAGFITGKEGLMPKGQELKVKTVSDTPLAPVPAEPQLAEPAEPVDAEGEPDASNAADNSANPDNSNQGQSDAGPGPSIE